MSCFKFAATATEQMRSAQVLLFVLLYITVAVSTFLWNAKAKASQDSIPLIFNPIPGLRDKWESFQGTNFSSPLTEIKMHSDWESS